MWGVTTASRNLTRLSCRDMEEMWSVVIHFYFLSKFNFYFHFHFSDPRFDLMLSYGELGPFLSIFSILSLILYFVTR